MARIEGVSKSQAGPVVKLVYRFGPRAMKKLAGRNPQTGTGIEPIQIWAYQPKMMMGMGWFSQAVRKGKAVDERIKNLVELKGAQMIGCEYCVDLGSQICRTPASPTRNFSPCRDTSPAACSPIARRRRWTTRSR
jgi:hypothetical protein